MLKIHPGAHWSSLQKRTFVGEHFAFFPANCLEGSELNWLGQLPGSAADAGAGFAVVVTAVRRTARGDLSGIGPPGSLYSRANLR